MKNQPSKKAEPLIGYVVVDEYEEGMANWSGFIAYPNPEGANLFWENPEPFIQLSAYQALQEKLDVATEAMTRFCDIEGYRVSAQSGHYIGQALAKIEGHD